MKFNTLLLITLMLFQQKNSIQYLNRLSNFYPGYLNTVNLQRIYNCTQNNVQAQKTVLAQKVDEAIKEYQPLEVKEYVPFQVNNASSTNNKSIENLPANLYQFMRTMIPSHILANHNLSNLKTTLEKYNKSADDKVSFNTLIQLQLKEPSVFNLLTAPKHFVVTNLKNIMKYANRTMPTPPCAKTSACTAAAMPTKDTGVADPNINSQSATQNILDGAANLINEILETNSSAEKINIMLPDIAPVENPINIIENSFIVPPESSTVVVDIGLINPNAESTVKHDYKPEMGQLEKNDRPRFETDYQHNPSENNFYISETPLTPNVSEENYETNAETDAPPDIKADDSAGYNDISSTLPDTSTGIVEPGIDPTEMPNNIRGMGPLDKNIRPINTLDETVAQFNPNSQNAERLKGERSQNTIMFETETDPPPYVNSAYETTVIPQIDIRFEETAVNAEDWPTTENYVTLSVAEIPGAPTAFTFDDEINDSNEIEDNWPTTYPTSTEGVYTGMQVDNDAADMPQAYIEKATTGANNIENMNVAPSKEEAFIDLGESFANNNVTEEPPRAAKRVYYETDVMPEDI